MPIEKKVDAKEQYAQFSKEAAIERAEEEFKAVETELLAAYDDSAEENPAAKRSEKLDSELADKWKHLRRIAMAQFPEGARILGLSPQNRLVAIAYCLGWPQADISKASGINRSTIAKWLTVRPDIQLFISEFNLKNGAKSVDILEKERGSLEYQAINCIKSIMSDKDDSEGIKRLKLDASKWVFAQTRGEQLSESATAGIRGLLEALAKTNAVSQPLTPEKEKELFNKTTN